MMPVGPLMIEHRLIERMIVILDQHIKTTAPGDIDLTLIDKGVDFLRSYADRCHHGKEEDILFFALQTKPMTADERRILNELMEEHTVARLAVRALAAAREQALQGNPEAYPEIGQIVGKIAAIYPPHIEKEDRRFFVPLMNYFSKTEQDEMLKQFYDFDQRLIHEKYRLVVENLEAAPGSQAKPASQPSADMAVYECTVCGYRYDPAVGDPENGIPPGTAFADLPDDWVCPLCKSGKELFERVS